MFSSPLPRSWQQPDEISFFSLNVERRPFVLRAVFVFCVFGRQKDPCAHSRGSPVCVLGKEFVELKVKIHSQGEQLLCGFRLFVRFLTGWGDKTVSSFPRVSKAILVPSTIVGSQL